MQMQNKHYFDKDLQVLKCNFDRKFAIAYFLHLKILLSQNKKIFQQKEIYRK